MRKRSHSENAEPFFDRVLSAWRFGKIIRHIPGNSRVLDLGCGFEGNLLRKIKDRISSGVGLDISVNHENEDLKIKLFAHDLNEKLPFSENEFDVVTSLANLEHLEIPKKTLEEIYRVLKPEGILLLTTPSTHGKPALEFLAFFGIVSKQEIQDHKNYFNKHNLLEYCKTIGFTSSTHKYFQLGMNNFLTAKK
jgi:ubiquinone/menaquinone biosynthesis C-methylase UbiE